ncbi:hypothetical protein N0V88_003208 [Collariella sp. IMI 366227]|nr:hypothetical protein N0V88_003208 [Collariella sp. IMI 366227]
MQVQIQILTRRRLHLAPPFLLDDDYTPQYTRLSSVDAAEVPSKAYAHLRNCNLFVGLQEVGDVHNINLVALGILHARDHGLQTPVIYNTSAYDSLALLELLDGLLWEPATAKCLLKAEVCATTARESIKAMQAQVGDLWFTADGVAKRGLLVHHLIMLGFERESTKIMRFLAVEVSRDCFVNIMEQYHPDAYRRYAEINRAVTADKVSSV